MTDVMFPNDYSGKIEVTFRGFVDQNDGSHAVRFFLLAKLKGTNHSTS